MAPLPKTVRLTGCFMSALAVAALIAGAAVVAAIAAPAASAAGVLRQR